MRTRRKVLRWGPEGLWAEKVESALGLPHGSGAQPVFVEHRVGGGRREVLEGCSLLAPPREAGVSLPQLTPLGKWSTSPFPPLSLEGLGTLYVPSPSREKATPLDQL